MPVWKCHRITTASVINLLLDEVMTKPETISWFWPQSVFHSRTPFNPAQVRCSDHWLLHHLISSVVKESSCQCRRRGFDPWVGKKPWRRKWQPTPVFLPEASHGWRSLADYSPWDHRVGHDWTTKRVCTCARAHTHTHTHTHTYLNITQTFGGEKNTQHN